MVVMSLLMSSPPISILHQLFRRRYSNSGDIVASWLLPFLPHRQSALERLLTGYMAAGGFISQLHCMAQHPVYQLTMTTPLITLLGIQYYYCLGRLLHGNLEMMAVLWDCYSSKHIASHQALHKGEIMKIHVSSISYVHLPLKNGEPTCRLPTKRVGYKTLTKHYPHGLPIWTTTKMDYATELTTPENTITYHNALCLSPQNFA